MPLIKSMKRLQTVSHHPNPNLALTLDKAPRAPTTKVRRYEHVDLSREFQIRQERREQAKREKLEELYDKHDQRVAQIKQVAVVSGDASELSEWEKMTDGEGGLQVRRERMDLQEMASRELIDEMR